MERLVKGVVL